MGRHPVGMVKAFVIGKDPDELTETKKTNMRPVGARYEPPDRLPETRLTRPCGPNDYCHATKPSPAGWLRDWRTFGAGEQVALGCGAIWGVAPILCSNPLLAQAGNREINCL